MRLVNYTSSSLLNCSPCGGTAVICVASTLVASGAPFLDVRIVSVQQLPGGYEGKPRYSYNLQYDENLLADPTYFLNGCDISGIFCRGCLVSYIDYLFSLTNTEVPNTVIDTPSIDLTASGLLNRTIQADLNLSAQAGNQALILADGLFVAAGSGETPNSATDTTSVNLTLSGAFNRNIQADVIISTQPGNSLSLIPDGLYAAGETANIAADTATVNMTVSGPLGKTISADVNISATPGNNIVALGDGIACTFSRTGACSLAFFNGI